MHAIVVEREADHDRVHAEHALEVADDRDRATGADGHRLVAPFLLQRLTRLHQRGAVERQLQRRRATVVLELDLAVGRHARADRGVGAQL